MRPPPPRAATRRSNNDGMVEFTMRVAAEGGGQLSDPQVLEVRELIERLVSTTSMSTRPAIYGMVAERELARLARCARTHAHASLGSNCAGCRFVAARVECEAVFAGAARARHPAGCHGHQRWAACLHAAHE